MSIGDSNNSKSANTLENIQGNEKKKVILFFPTAP